MKFFRHWALLLIISLLSLPFARGQMKLVGYVPIYNFRQPDIHRIPVSKLTHLNLAFIRPDSTGTITIPLWVDSLIELAHAAKVHVLGSIGGGNPPAYYLKLLAVPQRDRFINNLVAFVTQHKLDGIDVDLEGNFIDSNYQQFVTALAKQLKPRKKLFTAALATWSSRRIPDAALQQFDFINVMSYDKTGPWTPNTPGPHASFEMALSDLHYWLDERKQPKRKIVLGVPFYGYRFGNSYVRGMSYAEIIQNFPTAAVQDSVTIADSVRIYYNGTSTIETKTKLAMKQAGGIMIWQLLQDADADASLLQLIRRTMRRKK